MKNRLRNLKIFALVLCALLGIHLSSVAFPIQAVKDPFNEEKKDWKTYLDRLSLEQKVGQVFIFGFPGVTTERHLGKMIRLYQPGGIIVFGRNIKTAYQIAKLNRKAQKISLEKTGVPLLISVDQEGGKVIRIKTSPPLPSALSIGLTENPNLAQKAGFFTGQLLYSLGFNMNLAPVLDVKDGTKKSFLGTRSFGQDPEIVSKMGTAFALGLKKAGILPTAKHFPGHGGVITDSHKKTPVKFESLEELMAHDISPFRSFNKIIGNPAVMVAHISFPSIDPSDVPATFSPILIGEILRKKLKFDGLVITDDIEMAGSAQIGSIEERAIRTLEAGVDMIMVAWSRRAQRRAYRAVLNAVKEGRISEQRLNESLRRILQAKLNYANFQVPKKIKLRGLKKALKDPNLRRVSNEISRLNFKRAAKKTRKKRKGTALPTAKKFLVFSASTRFYKSFRRALLAGKASFYRLSKFRKHPYRYLFSRFPKALGIFYVTGGQTARIANRLPEEIAARTILVNSDSPAKITDPKKFLAVVTVGSRHPDLGRMTVEFLESIAGQEDVRDPAGNLQEPDDLEDSEALEGLPENPPTDDI